MNIEATILRAMLRVARRREAAEEDALAVRVGGSHAEVRVAIRRLENAGLVERRPSEAPRLTLAGLAVAVGLLPGAEHAGRSMRRASRAA
jgi:Mn-dependent DtxR family transcriptional regulator